MMVVKVIVGRLSEEEELEDV
ncbi:hypothetical protein Tco_0515628, partial [Tanacetum coccineum]